MHTTVTTRSLKAAGLVGSIISVALVFGGSAAVAEGLRDFASSGVDLSAGFGAFSETDIAALEQATLEGTTASKLAELEADASGFVVSPKRVPGPVAAAPEVDVFPYSGRVLTLLVPQVDTAVKVPTTARPGLTRPVGVPYSLLRSRTPLERSAN